MKIRVLSAIGITMLFVYFLFPQINIDLFIERFRNISYFELTLGFFALVIANVLRTVRFKTMDVYGGRLSEWWHINQTYNVFTTLLPGGGGEIATSYLMKFSTKKPSSIFCALRTLVLSRLMDLLFYSVILLLTAILIIDISDYTFESISIALVFAAISWLALIRSVERGMLSIIERFLVNKFSILERFREQLTELIVVSDMHHKRGIARLTLFQSSLIVISAAFSVYYTMLSLSMPVTWYQGFYCLGLFALFQLIPIQGVAGIGTQAAWWAFAITASGCQTNDVVVIGFMLHIIFFIYILLMFVPSFFYFLVKRYINPY